MAFYDIQDGEQEQFNNGCRSNQSRQIYRNSLVTVQFLLWKCWSSSQYNFCTFAMVPFAADIKIFKCLFLTFLRLLSSFRILTFEIFDLEKIGQVQKYLFRNTMTKIKFYKSRLMHICASSQRF